jgi:1,2-diacylglycerol 3-beta-galactosyltransferase
VSVSSAPTRLDVPVSTRVLLLTADTGGGHRASAEALCEAFDDDWGGTVFDPLTGPTAPRILMRLARMYGPLVRHAPWLWGLLFHATDIAPVRRLMTAVLSRALRRTLRTALEHHGPEVVVVLHPLLVAPAHAARRGGRARVVTVVTDRGRPHGSWRHPEADHLVVARRGLFDEDAELPLGLPIRRQFIQSSMDRSEARRRLGLDPDRFTVMVSGGGEGSRGTERWARALVHSDSDVDVLVVCGCNERLRRRLARLTPPKGRRLVVTGFVDDIAAHMNAADLLVTKAGPGVIAESAALGLPVLIAGYLPGQEVGNREHVVATGSGLAVESTRALVAAVERLRTDPALLARLRAGARRAARPEAGARTTDLIATLLKENPCDAH